MGELSWLIPFLACMATAMGLMSMMVANHTRCPLLSRWGRRFYLVIFCLIGITCLIMAVTWPRGVLPCSLAIAALLLSMLWHPANPALEDPH